MILNGLNNIRYLAALFGISSGNLGFLGIAFLTYMILRFQAEKIAAEEEKKKKELEKYKFEKEYEQMLAEKKMKDATQGA